MRALLFVSLVAACGSSSMPMSTPDATPSPDAPDDTWTSWAMGFMQTYCTDCHSPGGQGDPSGDKDFTMYSVVKTWASTIRCGTAATLQSGCSGFPPPKQFPIASPYPSDAERDRIVRWIDQGAPQ